MSKTPEQLESDIADYLVLGGRVVAEQTPSRAVKRPGRTPASGSMTKGKKSGVPTRSGYPLTAKKAMKKPRKTAAELKGEVSDYLRAGPTRHPTSAANPSGAAHPVVLVREGDGWRQYMVISDERVAIVHMKPAPFGGWRFDRVEVQGKGEWPGMKRDAIVEWKFSADDGRTRIAEGLGNFRARLLEVARAGQVLR